MLGDFVKIEFLDKKLTFIIVWYDEEFLAVYIKDNWVLTPVFTSAASKIKTGLTGITRLANLNIAKDDFPLEGCVKDCELLFVTYKDLSIFFLSLYLLWFLASAVAVMMIHREKNENVAKVSSRMKSKQRKKEKPK